MIRLLEPLKEITSWFQKISENKKFNQSSSITQNQGDVKTNETDRLILFQFILQKLKRIAPKSSNLNWFPKV